MARYWFFLFFPWTTLLALRVAMIIEILVYPFEEVFDHAFTLPWVIVVVLTGGVVAGALAHICREEVP